MTKFCDIHIPDMTKVSNLIHKHSTQLSNFGPVYQLLKKQFTRYFSLDENEDIIIVSSGHTAIMTALNALESKRILVPAYTFASTLQAVEQQGLKVHLTDVNEDGYLDTRILDWEFHDSSFDTVLLVTPLSVIPDIQNISKWCKVHNVKLIIDGAASFGTSNIHKEADAFCMSFHATKSFPVGEAGAVILKKEYSERAYSFINFGMNKDKTIVNTGINGKISEYTAAIAFVLLEEISKDLEQRYLNSTLYTELLKNHVNIKLPNSHNANTIYQSFPIWTPNAKIIQKKLLDINVETIQYYKPLKNFINTLNLYESSLCLPCHPSVTKKEIEDICYCILDMIKS